MIIAWLAKHLDLVLMALKGTNVVDVCLEQAKAGLAWYYRKYEHEQSPEDRKLYADDEALNLPSSSIKTSCSQQTGATLSFQG
jgi:hypothetical protein